MLDITCTKIRFTRTNCPKWFNILITYKDWFRKTKDQRRFPLLWLDFVQSVHRPLARLRLIIALPPVVLIRLQKPWVRARDFLDLLLLVWQRAAFPALTTRPRLFSVVIPWLKFRPSDKPAIHKQYDTKFWMYLC